MGIAKKAGEMWKSLPADKKKTYEERATKAKAEYAAYIAKVKGTEAFQAYMDKKAAARKKKLARSVRSAMHKVPKDAKLKKPLSGYMLWFKGARSTIKGKNVAEVSKKAGEMWKGLSAEKKKPFADKALEAKKTYDAYVATGKGPANEEFRRSKSQESCSKSKGESEEGKGEGEGGCKKRKGTGFERKGKSQGSSGKREGKSHEGSKGRKGKSQGGSKGKSQGGEKSKGKGQGGSKGKSQGGEKR